MNLEYGHRSLSLKHAIHALITLAAFLTSVRAPAQPSPTWTTHIPIGTYDTVHAATIDSGGNLIVVVDGFVAKVSGDTGNLVYKTASPLPTAAAITSDANGDAIVCTSDCRLYKIDPIGTILWTSSPPPVPFTVAGSSSGPSQYAESLVPLGVHTDPYGNIVMACSFYSEILVQIDPALYVDDTGSCLAKFDSSGTYLGTATGNNNEQSSPDFPLGLKAGAQSCSFDALGSCWLNEFFDFGPPFYQEYFNWNSGLRKSQGDQQASIVAADPYARFGAIVQPNTATTGDIFLVPNGATLPSGYSSHLSLNPYAGTTWWDSRIPGIVLNGYNGAQSFDLKTGQVLWSYNGRADMGVQEDRKGALLKTADNIVSLIDSTGSQAQSFALDCSPIFMLEQDEVGFTLGIFSDGTSRSVSISRMPLQLTSQEWVGIHPSASLGGTCMVTVSLGSPAGPSGITLPVSYSSPIITGPSSVQIPAGAWTSGFQININSSSTFADAPQTVTVGSSTSSVYCYANSFGIAVIPNFITGGFGVTGNLTFAFNAAADTTVNLSSSNTAIAHVQASVVMPKGSKQITFNVVSSPVDVATNVSLSASCGSASSTCTLTVYPAILNSVKVTPTSVVGGHSATGEVTLSAKAGPSGTVVNLWTVDATVKVPSTVTVAAGTNYQYFPITTSAVTSNKAVAVYANTPGRSAHFAVLEVTLPATLKVSKNPVVGGSSLQGTIGIPEKAPSTGSAFSLTSSDPSVKVPSPVTVPSGSTYVYFPISTTAVTSLRTVTISAVGPGQLSAMTTLEVSPQPLVLKLLTTSVKGGSGCMGEVVIYPKAGSSGDIVTLSSSSSSVKLPASITVPAGQNYLYFPITTTEVTLSKTVKLSATDSSGTVSATLSVTP